MAPTRDHAIVPAHWVGWLPVRWGLASRAWVSGLSTGQMGISSNSQGGCDVPGTNTLTRPGRGAGAVNAAVEVRAARVAQHGIAARRNGGAEI